MSFTQSCLVAVMHAYGNPVDYSGYCSSCQRIQVCTGWSFTEAGNAPTLTIELMLHIERNVSRTLVAYATHEISTLPLSGQHHLISHPYHH